MGKRPEVGFDPAVPRSRRPQQILRIVLGGKILVAQFRVGGKKFFKRAAFRGFHKSRRDQAHPEQGERVVILLAREIGRASCRGRKRVTTYVIDYTKVAIIVVCSRS